jgi:hypothetical protein
LIQPGVDCWTIITAERELSASCDRCYVTGPWIDSSHPIHREFNSNQIPGGIYYETADSFQSGFGLKGGDDTGPEVNTPDNVPVLHDVKCFGAVDCNRCWIVDLGSCSWPLISGAPGELTMFSSHEHGREN